MYYYSLPIPFSLFPLPLTLFSITVCLHGLSHKIISLWKKHLSIYCVYFFMMTFTLNLFNNTLLSLHCNCSFLCHLELAKVGRSQISFSSLKRADSFSFSDNGHCVSLEIFLGTYYFSATSVGKLKSWKQISLDGSPSCQNEPSIHYWIIHLLHLDLQLHFSSKLLSWVLGIFFFCHFWTHYSSLLHSWPHSKATSPLSGSNELVTPVERAQLVIIFGRRH